MTTPDTATLPNIRKETDSLGEVNVPANILWGAQTQRSLEHFSIGHDLIPREMITSYATLKKAAANVNHAAGRLSDEQHRLLVETCDEILNGLHQDIFPLHVWMTGSGTQFNMNVNEVIANRCSQLAGTPLGSKTPVHPNDHVNMSQSSNDSFPTAMNIAAAVNVTSRLRPAITCAKGCHYKKVQEWENIVKIGRTHMQDATPLTLGQEWSGYAVMLGDCLDRIEDALKVCTNSLSAVRRLVQASMPPRDLRRRPRPRSPDSRNCLLSARPINSRYRVRTTHSFISLVHYAPYRSPSIRSQTTSA